MDTFARCYAHLPSGTWWIRWIDGIVINAGRRTVTVRLAPWPDPAIRGDAIRMKEGGIYSWTISASNLALFAVGDVFHEGRVAKSELDASRVRSVCDRAVAGESTRSFTVDLPQGDLGDKGLNDKYPGPSPDIWSPFIKPLVLSRTLSPNISPNDARGRLLRAAERHVLIASSEMLRVFIAPHGRVLRALLSAPLDEAVRSLAVNPALAPEAPGRFRVDLLPGVPHEMAPYVANLQQSFNPDGHRDASRLWACLDPPPTARRPAPLPALMPFYEGVLRFSAKCFEIFPGYFLACRITSFDWPDARPVEASHLAGWAGAVVGAAPPAQPQLNPIPDAVFDPSTDPGPTAEELPHFVETATMGRQPNLTRVVRPRDDHRAAVSTESEQCDTDSTAMGPTDPDSDAAAVIPVPQEASVGQQDADQLPLPSRFRLVLGLLGELKPAAIASFDPLSSELRGSKRGGVPVFEVEPRWVVGPKPDERRPPVRSWTWVRVDEKPKPKFYPRVILVVRIVLASGVVVHWFDAEGEPPQAHAAILIRFTSDARVEAVVAAITAGAGRLAGSEFVAGGSKAMPELGIAAATTYDHRVNATKALSADHARAVLRRLDFS